MKHRKEYKTEKIPVHKLRPTVPGPNFLRSLVWMSYGHGFKFGVYLALGLYLAVGSPLGRRQRRKNKKRTRDLHPQKVRTSQTTVCYPYLKKLIRGQLFGYNFVMKNVNTNFEKRTGIYFWNLEIYVNAGKLGERLTFLKRRECMEVRQGKMTSGKETATLITKPSFIRSVVNIHTWAIDSANIYM
jgi:hypothetical protein